jgi:hypothetical protein
MKLILSPVSAEAVKRVEPVPRSRLVVSGPLLAFALTCCVTAALPQGVQAAVVIKTSGSDFRFGTGPDAQGATNTFSNGGFSITFSSPSSANPSTVSRTIDGSGVFASVPGGGTCLGGSRPAAAVAVCGNSVSNSIAPQFTSINISTNRALFVKGFTVVARASIRDGTAFNQVRSTLSNGLGSIGQFDFAVDTTVDTPSYGHFYVRQYTQALAPFFVAPSNPLTLNSSFTAGYMDYWVSSVTVEDVPGPLPILGAAVAFTWSRKIRRKLKS